MKNMEEKPDVKAQESDEHESEEDESEILEESPCGRWLKRSEEVSQRNVPGIDRAYLAMDSEEGVEVVWNEVQFSERKSFKQQEEKIKAVFDNLMRINHANIVNFHRYWIDYSKEQQKTTRVVFITEYMSSGSVKEFLNKTKDIHKYKRTKSWKRWCTQILSALTYLHNCNPPVIHGNMTCDTIFIQHNGLVKIGSVAPDAIRNHVKTYHEIKRNMHYYAPEYTAGQGITPAVDIYSFGICALEMAVPRSQLHYKESKSVTAADIERAIDVLDDPLQRDFIRLCLTKDPNERPSARSLLLHRLLFEVHSLKLLAAHAFVKNQRILPEYKQKDIEKDLVIAEVTSSTPKVAKLKDIPALDVDKFLEDVKNGVYPLTSFALPQPPWPPSNPSMPSQAKGQVTEGHQVTEPAEEVPEMRRIIHAQGSIMPLEKIFSVTIHLRFEDKMNRYLSCEMLPDESAETLSSELVQHRLVKSTDKGTIKKMIEEGIKSTRQSKTAAHFSTGPIPHPDSGGDQAVTISTTVHSGPTPSPLTDSSLQMIYSNFQNQMLQKPPLPIANPAVPVSQFSTQLPGSLPIFPTTSQATLGAALPQGLPATQQSVAQAQPPVALPPLGQAGILAAPAQSMVLTPHQLQMQQFQYLQYLQQQQAAATQAAPVFVPTQMPAGQQPLYVPQSQAGMTLPVQPHATTAQRHVHFQSPTVQPTAQNQVQPPAGPIQPAALPPFLPAQSMFPVFLQQQQQFLANQTPLNPAMLHLQQPRMPLQGTAAGTQRPAAPYSLPHAQPPQAAQSSNNSNNIVFVRSNSKADEASSLKGQQLLFQQATPHSSSASVASTITEQDFTGVPISPPTSQTVVTSSGSDGGTQRQ